MGKKKVIARVENRGKGGSELLLSSQFNKANLRCQSKAPLTLSKHLLLSVM